MYRYYKSHITGEYVVMFDNKLVGAVEDRRFKCENDAKVRVYNMNLTFHLCEAIRYTKNNLRNYDWPTILHCSRSNDSMLYGIAQRVADLVCRYMDEYGEKHDLLSDWWIPLDTDEYEIMKRMCN